MAIWMMLIAALTGAGSNLFMRRTIDATQSSKGFLVFQLSVSALMAVLLNPVRTGHFHASLPSFALGILAGLVLFATMRSLGRAMEVGPPGLTLAAMNSATVMPAIIMATIFQTPYTLTHALGSLLVVVGLFWAGWAVDTQGDKRRWFGFVAMAFVFHVLLLCILQWRALMPLDVETSQWFNPILFVTTSSLMIASYRTKPHPAEISYGSLAGILNGICIFLLVLGPEVATPLELGMIFPVFAVGLIILNNLWGQALYNERVNWRANLLCVLGVIIGTVNWSQLINN